MARPHSTPSSQVALFATTVPRAVGLEAIPEADLMEADKTAPPSTFFECTLQAYNAAAAAIKDGYKLLEVEFPPLPAAEMASQASSANSIGSANINLANEMAQYFVREGKQVVILVPDKDELDLIEEGLGTLSPSPNVTIRAVRARNSESADTMGELILGIFSRAAKGKVLPWYNADVYISVISSGQELPDLEALHQADPTKPLIFFNLNLETHRGDLGLPAFPSKDLHYRFLSNIKPVYLLRTRQYAQTLSRPPFILNYQGALFRTYPGGYQCMLDTGSGRYRRVETSRERPALSGFKDIITQALDVEDNDTLASLRRGAFSKTWWEKEEGWAKESSDNWRT
ncbi:hypothetical protein NSK_003319 [Nannochloropsis salina CCMP1776]|uniref:DUF1995 domain-containing protein n=1 Tax=Nannochloropsis salina CCMP1776 TaxID=1027361 RepID=A0A4D9D1S0_9STRA|nr:hypothetical protein NSK_003319 [Nannochloropsis salina CCMP1776]|eukprot:TFJ85360.1 hypothetical protein NSK_003319 [Nannochloropsis salina CCMP1776]